MSQLPTPTLLTKVEWNGKTTWQRLEIFIEALKSPLKHKIAERIETLPDKEIITYNDDYLSKYIMDGNKYQVQRAMWNSEGNKLFIILKLNEENPDRTEHREIIGEIQIYYSVNAKDTYENTIKLHAILINYAIPLVHDGSPVIILEYIENQNQHDYPNENLSEEVIITRIALREQQRCCDNHPHISSTLKFVSDNSSKG
ncbi:15513_t:CDS:2 [Acaulospora morrowiae]|uniref:15513_t:CDS:1 n=1 Tax=Acaulospora morrowiae TaxID=94023 RepID=A0A9N9GBT2_9GLOM|nr:15513_t:CDS:2 [Acaulospora morrowiae]